MIKGSILREKEREIREVFASIGIRNLGIIDGEIKIYIDESSYADLMPCFDDDIVDFVVCVNVKQSETKSPLHKHYDIQFLIEKLESVIGGTGTLTDKVGLKSYYPCTADKLTVTQEGT